MRKYVLPASIAMLALSIALLNNSLTMCTERIAAGTAREVKHAAAPRVEMPPMSGELSLR